jgi:endoglucanase
MNGARIFVLALILCGAWGAARADGECRTQGDATALSSPKPPHLRRGVNLSGWWQDESDQALDANDIQNLRALGFDFVRLPLSPQWLAPSLDEERANLRCDIISLLNAGFFVVVDLHPGDDFDKKINAAPFHAAQNLARLWRHMVPVLQDLPPSRVLLELYNEPNMDPDLWWHVQAELITGLRPFFPHNTFVVASAPKDGLWTLAQQKPYADPNLIYDFHYYMPLFFTHHGANWLDDKALEKTNPITYPSEPREAEGEEDSDVKKYAREAWNRAKLVDDIHEIVAWRDRYKVLVACFEFGVYKPFNDEGSLTRWLSDMRSILEGDHFPWALWEYQGGFGLLNTQDVLDEGMAKALDLSHTNGP